VPEQLIRAVVIDPDPRWRQAVATALQQSGAEVVASSGDPTLAPRLASAGSADLLLLGVAGETDSPELQRWVRRLHDACRDLITFVYVGPGDIANAAAALAGGAYRALDRRLDAPKTVADVIEAYKTERRARVRRPRLSRRELEILRLVAQGRPNREVAKILWVTDQTIKFHLANTYKKLNVRNRVEAIHWARQHGLFPPDDPPEPDPGVREPRRPIQPTLTDGIILDPPEPSEEDDTDHDAVSQAA
jgi:DNA-binding NarL/FixJ family response regulator